MDSGRRITSRFLSISFQQCLYLALLLPKVHAQPAPAPAITANTTVIVLPVLTEGLHPSATTALTAIIQKELITEGRLTLVDPAQVANTTSRMMNSSGGTVRDLSTVIELGKSLGARYVLSTTVVRIGDEYRIDLQAVDIQSGLLKCTEIEDFRGKVQRVQGIVREKARRIVLQLGNRPSVLYVTTDPPQSTVSLDGVSRGFAPLEMGVSGGLEYRLRVSRVGYADAFKEVNLDEGDTLKVHLKLRKLPPGYDRPLAVRFWLNAGLPMHTSSSTLDPAVGLGGGHTFGGAVSAGGNWRLRVGGFAYSADIRSIHDTILEEYQVDGRPVGETSVILSDLIYSRSNDHFGPKVGVGVIALNRKITTRFLDGSRSSRSTDFEAGWNLSLGFEFSFTRKLAGSLDIMHSGAMTSIPSWRTRRDEFDPYWDNAFANFDKITMVQFQLGYRI